MEEECRRETERGNVAQYLRSVGYLGPVQKPRPSCSLDKGGGPKQYCTSLDF